MVGRGGLEFDDVIELLDSGGEPSESTIVRLLLRRDAPGTFIERLSRWAGIFKTTRALAHLVRHPACPFPFAFKALHHLGWRDLAEICRDPRTTPVVRQQTERKTIERLVSLTLGEKVALARLATGGVLATLLLVKEPRCVEALIDNPRFTEAEAIRLLANNREPQCILALIRHPVWGRRREVIRAAVLCPLVPLGIALGLAASLSDSELKGLRKSPEISPALRDAVAELLADREYKRSTKSSKPE